MDQKLAKLMPFILITAGFLFIVFGVIRSYQQKTFTQTSAVITKIESDMNTVTDRTEHYVYVRYTAEGKEYEELLDTYSAGMTEGKELTVLYDPDAPSHVVLRSGAGSIVYIAFGTAAALGGMGLLFKRRTA